MLTCPQCLTPLPSKFLIVFNIKNLGSQSLLPCKKCGYELIDPFKYQIWMFKGFTTGIVLGTLGVSILNTILVFVPITIIVYLLLYISLPLKKEVIRSK